MLTTWIMQLLDRDPSRRLGSKPQDGGPTDLRSHPWFQTIDWDTLETKQQTAPFIPDVRVYMPDISLGAILISIPQLWIVIVPW